MGKAVMRKRILTMICFAAGLSLCSYPIISSVIEQKIQEKAIATYEKDINEKMSSEHILKQAKYYNRMLNQTKGAVVGVVSKSILSDESYQSQLNIGGNGIMGSLEIPQISVYLPIRHGTSEEVLANGVGHLRESSLPVGGENTRCILTSHRGIPSSKLFTRLDELEKNDLFFVHVCGETLAYQVYDIQVIEPDEAEKLHVIEGKDIVSLITCTPYGINTHRLVVSGERVSYDKKIYNRIKPEIFSVRELIFSILPFLFSVIMTGMYIKSRKVQRKR